MNGTGMRASVRVTTPPDLGIGDMVTMRFWQEHGDGLYLVEVNGKHATSVTKSPKKITVQDLLREIGAVSGEPPVETPDEAPPAEEAEGDGPRAGAGRKRR